MQEKDAFMWKTEGIHALKTEGMGRQLRSIRARPDRLM